MQIDTTGLRCPLVVITVKRQIKKSPDESAFTIISDDKDASVDLAAMALTMGLKFKKLDAITFTLAR